MRIVTSQKTLTGVSFSEPIGCEGKLWRYRPTATGHFTVANDLREIPMPSGVSGVRRRPSWRNYNLGQRSYLFGTGAWSANVVVDELMRGMRQGIPAPFVVPSVSAAAGPGPSGAAICYLRFLDSRGARFGPLSAASSSVTLANQSRAWATLPQTCLDSSVDSLQGLVSMDGATPRVAWTRQLGVSSLTEAVATLALAEADPGAFTDMPLGSMNEVYHERQVIAGNDRYPQRAHFSALGELEHYEGLSIDTDGEPVNGLFAQNDLLFMGSFLRIYRIAGYTAADMSREIEKPDIGIVCHHGIVNMHKRSLVPTTVGFQMYDGQWHYLMDDRRKEWEREYRLHRADYEAAQGFYHPLRNVFMFGPVPHSEFSGSVHWTLDAKRLLPEIEADEFTIAWANDERNREDTTRASFFLPGSAQPQVVVGSTYGILLDDNADGPDDDDNGMRKMEITPATLMPDPGGGIRDGNTFHRVWLYFQSPENVYHVEFRTGQEGCADNPGASFAITIDDTQDVSALEPLTSRPHLLKFCAGEAISFTISVPHPDVLDEPPARGNVVFRGYGLTYGPGVKARMLVDATPPG